MVNTDNLPVFDNIEVRGLSAIQSMILSVFLNPAECVKRFGNIAVPSLANYTGVSQSQIKTAIANDIFINALYKSCTSELKLKRTQIDQALINSASINGPAGAKDRLLYYKMIGALETQKPESESSLSGATREQKISAIKEFMNKHNRVKLNTGRFVNDRNTGTGTGTDKSDTERDRVRGNTRTEGAEEETTGEPTCTVFTG